MRLLTQTQLITRQLLGTSGGFTLGVIAGLAVVEIVGRQTASDLHDSLAASLLGLAVLAVSWRHKQSPLPWVTWITDQVVKLAPLGKMLSFEIGIDLRGNPPIRRGYPPLVVGMATGLAGILLLIALFGQNLPLGFRTLGTHGCYVGYLVGLTALWTALMLTGLLAVLFPVVLIHDACVAAHVGPGPRSRNTELAAVLGYFGIVLTAGLVLPIWAKAGLCVVALVVNLATTLVPANREVQFLWRPGSGGAVRAIPWGHWALCEFGGFTLIVLALIGLSCGDRLFGGRGELAAELMPLTTLLGTLLAALAPGALGAWAAHSVVSRWRDPARPARPTLHVAGATAATARQLRSLTRARGWGLATSPRKPADAVGVTLVEAEQSQATEFDPSWPLAISVADLEKGDVFRRLERRDEIQTRRRIVGALESLFKWAARKKYRDGSGFWLAPHYWFVTGLTRDGQDKDVDMDDGSILSGSIGPPFHRLLTRPCRHYLFQLLRSMQVDLIFIEDGVTYQRFRRVLRMLFEVYDRNGGKRPADESHFRGLPGTRVLIHEFAFDEPFKSETYPEPKYEFLGRARILHVFKDRGEQDEPLDTPFDFSFTPQPLMMG